MKLYEALKYGENYLKDRGIPDAPTDAWLLLEFVTGISRAWFLAERTGPMDAEAELRYRALLKKRGDHIPLQHLTGEQEFMGMRFLVNEHVLIPRQDTEILVEESLKRLKPGMRVLDLCTGSGCIAVGLLKLGAGRRVSGSGLPPEQSGDEKWGVQVDGADISSEALLVAEENCRRLNAGVQLIQSDLFSEIHGRYDMIVSNPPYIRTSVIEELSEEVRLHEPYQALDGKEDGLYFYREIIRESSSYLTENGWLLFEIGYDQGEQVSGMMRESGFDGTEIIRDLAGLDRVVAGRRGKRDV
ncbi:MAG: peptide chain release factor N(5)-glutamine methyltransferase [Candidatus Choladocola sp.]|nr:peptide chain release factor N(5)-glutamine methyltransferase [Candidatus Choladocola sp.]